MDATLEGKSINQSGALSEKGVLLRHKFENATDGGVIAKSVRVLLTAASGWRWFFVHGLASESDISGQCFEPCPMMSNNP